MATKPKRRTTIIGTVALVALAMGWALPITRATATDPVPIVLSPTVIVTIGFDDHQLQAGDAIAFESSIPHRLYNAGGEPVQGIWFVLGRNSGGGAGAFEH